MLGQSQPLHGFTLIELLVVITIIVVLLALLTPALDRAIYQAQLVVCGAQQRAMMVGMQNYAFEHRRFYPYKKHFHSSAFFSPIPYVKHAGNNRYTDGSDLSTPTGGGYDLRPIVEGYYDFESLWLDPLAGFVDLGYNDNDFDANILSAGNTFDSLTFYEAGSSKGRPLGQGMTKVGNRIIFSERRAGQNELVRHSFNLLTGDRMTFQPGGWSSSSHTDREGGAFQLAERQNTGGVAGVPGSGHASWKGTYSHYNYLAARDNPWGTMDMNFGLQDGAVVRVDNLEMPRTAPPYHDDDYPLTAVIWNGNEANVNGVTIQENREFLFK